MSGLILGSNSPYRRELMQRLRVPFSVHSPNVDESEVKRSGIEPTAIVQELARLKVAAVRELHPNAVVIASDQAAVLDGRLFDKPGNVATAIDQLQRLRGREHRLLTAVAIAHHDGVVEFTDLTRMTMRRLSDAEIERYVRAERPLDCAGSYRVEGLGVTLFERIDTRDHTAIMGLPLMRLSAELRRLGVALP
ncbi:MAG: septum formation protein Maf [Planctomycetes bacterium]|nr:septum formation protein Maf [Planctomycetota bacterium]